MHYKTITEINTKNLKKAYMITIQNKSYLKFYFIIWKCHKKYIMDYIS